MHRAKIAQPRVQMEGWRQRRLGTSTRNPQEGRRKTDLTLAGPLMEGLETDSGAERVDSSIHELNLLPPAFSSPATETPLRQSIPESQSWAISIACSPRGTAKLTLPPATLIFPTLCPSIFGVTIPSSNSRVVNSKPRSLLTCAETPEVETV